MVGIDREFAAWLKSNQKQAAPTWLGWIVHVDEHAVERWQERYTHDDAAIARTTIIRRMIVGLNKYHDVHTLNRAGIKSLAYVSGKHYRETGCRIRVGDMRFVYSRRGRMVRVYTCYP